MKTTKTLLVQNSTTKLTFGKNILRQIVFEIYHLLKKYELG
jgi:hypothetical protein